MALLHFTIAAYNNFKGKHQPVETNRTSKWKNVPTVVIFYAIKILFQTFDIHSRKIVAVVLSKRFSTSVIIKIIEYHKPTVARMIKLKLETFDAEFIAWSGRKTVTTVSESRYLKTICLCNRHALYLKVEF